MTNTYKIEKITDFLKVPEDRLEDCLKKFNAWLAATKICKDIFGETVQLSSVFNWEDDGLK